MEYFGGIEAGGTKFVCVISSGPDNILVEERFATVSPDETISKVIEFFENSSYELKIKNQKSGDW